MCLDENGLVRMAVPLSCFSENPFTKAILLSKRREFMSFADD